MNITNCKFNHETRSVELTLETGVVISISEDAFINVIRALPEFDDEYQIRELLKELWRIRRDRLLTYEELDKKTEALLSRFEENGQKLDNAQDKLEVFKYTSKTKNLSAMKVVFAERRMLLKQLALQEADLKGQLAKIIVGKSEKREES